jgi:hypothetical protein
VTERRWQAGFRGKAGLDRGLKGAESLGAWLFRAEVPATTLTFPYSSVFYPDFPDTSIKAIIAPEVCHVEKKKVY